ncbi:TetR family transcriptional regulator [Aureimonas endophytica]|uniref:TetR family transcriptional regulator n=1 Tax=Aureimonas endophytica TaxID=2027858 RepID=A0A917A1Y0_9HYPH|nr:TetR/AcrR family transcriptional regulator [Aureimonas endophytica]GGE22987.1 TetR family transcriptional regulator [Aureimonas endophytica]
MSDSMADKASVSCRPRERILDTARSLFRRCGIRGTGVDAIAESAGTNKMTLYRHFHSKDDLIVACLNQAAIEAEALWASVEAAAPGEPRRQLDHWVLLVGEALRADRGCEVSNAAVELSEACDGVRQTIAAFKRTQRLRLVALCRAAGFAEPERLADMLALMVEGARISRQASGDEGPSGSFADCARAAIASSSSREVAPAG